MAAPYDNAQTWLAEGSNLIRTYYMGFPDQQMRFGRINKVFQFNSKRPIQGNGVVVQVRDGNQYGARVDNDMLGGFPTPRSTASNTYTVTASETAASNHFRRINSSLQVSWFDVKRAYDAAISPIDWVADMIKQSDADVAETMSLHRNLDSTAKVGTISGTPKKNDKQFYADCAALTTTGGARFILANGSVAALPRNRVIDVYNGASLRYTVYVTDYNPVDQSVGVLGMTGGVPSTSVDISAIAANDAIYISGEYNKGLLSVGHWFSTPTASESFFGRDRTDANYRWLAVHRYAPSSSNVQLSKSHIDAAALQIAYRQEDDNTGYIAIMPPDLLQRYRNEIGALIMPVQDPQTGNKVADYGFDSQAYRHPVLGKVELVADAFAATNQIRLLKPSDWEMLPYINGGNFEWLPGDGNAGNWYRVESGTAGEGRTVIMKMDGFVMFADICLNPNRQIQIANVTA